MLVKIRIKRNWGKCELKDMGFSFRGSISFITSIEVKIEEHGYFGAPIHMQMIFYHICSCPKQIQRSILKDWQRKENWWASYFQFNQLFKESKCTQMGREKDFTRKSHFLLVIIIFWVSFENFIFPGRQYFVSVDEITDFKY